jgi:hypothetical protein
LSACVQPWALAGGVFGKDLFVGADEFTFASVCFLHAPQVESIKAITPNPIESLNLLFTIVHSPWASSVSGPSFGSCCSVASGLILWPGTRYSSLAHLLKSINLHRSEQKGREGLSCHSTGFPHVGHFGIRQK